MAGWCCCCSARKARVAKNKILFFSLPHLSPFERRRRLPAWVFLLPRPLARAPPSPPRTPGHANAASVRSQEEERTLRTLLKKKSGRKKGREKKGWEGTHHHDNAGRSRTNVIKKYGGNVVHPVIPVPTQKKKKRAYWLVCVRVRARVYGMALKMCPRVRDTHGFPLIHLFSPCLICHSDDKLK